MVPHVKDNNLLACKILFLLILKQGWLVKLATEKVWIFKTNHYSTYVADAIWLQYYWLMALNWRQIWSRFSINDVQYVNVEIFQVSTFFISVFFISVIHYYNMTNILSLLYKTSMILSSPELKAQVKFSDHLSSVCLSVGKLFTF